MLRMLESLWATAPDWLDPGGAGGSGVVELVPYTEDDEATEPCEPPTLPSTLDADAAYALAEKAIASGEHETAKVYMQYYNHVTRRL